MSISLSDDHELQVQSYLRFAKLKRDQHVREVVATMNEFRSDKFHRGDMYNFQEITNTFEELETEVKSLIDREIQNAYHTNALLVKILMSQAQAQGVEMMVDTNQLENEFLLKQVAVSESTALSRPASDFARRNTQLGKLGTVATVAVQDPQLLKERDGLNAELAQLRERSAKLQEQTTNMMRDRTALNNQINSLKDELAQKDAIIRSTQSEKDATVGRLQQDMSKLSTQAAGMSQLSSSQASDLQKHAAASRAELERVNLELTAAQNSLSLKEKEIRAANDALNGKLLESKQFQQMKKMMQAKSQEVVTLRKKLHKYEPQSIPSADQEADPSFA